MSLDPTLMRSPQLALPVGVFGGTYFATNAFLKHIDDQGLQANNPYRRVGVSALAGGLAGSVAYPFAQIAESAAKAHLSVPSQTHLQTTAAAFRAIQRPGVPANMIRNATRGFYPGFLAIGAVEGAREVYKRYQQQSAKPT